MTYISKAHEILKAIARPMTFKELVHDIPGSCGETISRAMRKLFERGLVTRKPQDPTKPNGPKLWTAIPTANQSTTSRTTKPTTQTVAAKSSGKVTVMCLPQNKPTLVTATLQTISELMGLSAKKFSAHDVTKHLREMVNDGKINVDHTESGTVHVHGKTVARIEHEDVKAIVHEYFHSGKMDGWTREMVNGHWEYNELPAQAATPPPVVLVVPAADYDGDPLL